MMIVREANPEDLRAVHSLGLAEYVQMTDGEAVVLVEDGAPTAVAGVVPVGEFTAAFAQWVPGRKPKGRGTMRLAHALLELVKKHPEGVTALADPGVPRSAELLAHLGFIHEDGNVWKWPCRSS